MKIDRIAIENLASLRGRQPDLELEGELLRDAGLIAITGPTGAGKTTVLDAICLALYDRTPRQRARGQDPRELLSRGAGQGRVAVDLTLDDGRRWTAEWSVHRARNKPDGALQPSRQRILDRTTGEIVADGKTAVQRAVEKNLDLSFEQFTGVILLAQGEFATFLESSDAERSELLERLTGTEIYSRLGKAAFDRHKELRVKLEQEEKRFEGLAPMPEARRKALEQELDELEPSLARLDRHLATLEEKLAWVERRRTLADRTASTGESLEKARRRHLQAREDRSRLRNARRAMALRPALVSADEATRRARAASHALERERETAREQNLSARDAGRALLRNSVRLEQALEASRRALEEREAQGGEAASDRSALADLRDRRRDGEAEDRLASQESAAVTDALSAQKARTLEGEKADGVLAAARERQDSSSAALADLEARRKKALGSETRQGLVKRAVLLDRAVELHRQLAQADPELLAEAAEGERLAADRASRACQASETKLEAATRELAEHRQALGRVERRAEMARHRSELAPGEPCPLCGSLEHPGINEAGAEDGLAELRQAKGTLEDLEQALLEAQGAHLEAQEAWITARSARQRGEDRLLESQRRFSELGSGWMELRLQLADLPLDPQDIETLSLGGLRARAQERLETAEALDEEEVQLKAANESTTRARDDAERERAVALERTLEAEKQLRAAESRRAAQRERRREAWDRWHHAARDLAARCGL
ncbi:MAG: AAA family ATPase, partial [Acidobacteriota bacterium]